MDDDRSSLWAFPLISVQIYTTHYLSDALLTSLDKLADDTPAHMPRSSSQG